MQTPLRMMALIAAAFCSTSLIASAAHSQAAPAAAAGGPESVPAPKLVAARQAQLPFELFRGNRVIVEVKINGHSTPAILDTGASATVLDRAFAEKIGLKKGRAIQGQGAGGAVEAELVSGVTLDIAGMHFEDMSVGVLDLAPVARQLGRPLPVIIGREFFNSAAIEFDWERKLLTITPSAQYRPAEGAVVLPVERRGPFDFVKVSVAGLPAIDALLDLGHGGQLKLPSDYWAKQPVLANLRYAESQSGGVGGMKPTRLVNFPTVSFGGATFSNVPGTMGGDSEGGRAEYGANLGIGILKQFDLVLDLGNKRLVLKPLGNPAFERERTGLQFAPSGEGLDVLFASPQGPAARAGIKAGDRIVAVDGKPVAADYFGSALEGWNRAGTDSAVTLALSDGRTVRFKLADYY